VETDIIEERETEIKSKQIPGGGSALFLTRSRGLAVAVQEGRSGMATIPTDLDRTCEHLGKLTEDTLEEQYGPNQIGYATMVFEFGQCGYLAFLSNAGIPGMIQALQQALLILQEAEHGREHDHRH
jgi:hypothetical protein